MQHKFSNEQKILASISFVFLLLIFWFQPAYYLSGKPKVQYHWSQESMVADMSYAEHQQMGSVLAQRITPPILEEQLGAPVSKTYLSEQYVAGKPIPTAYFDPYESNLVWHRYLHYGIQLISPFSYKVDLVLVRLMHALLSAAALTIVFLWLQKISSTLCSYCVLGLHFFSYDLALWGSNLYFALWSLYIPVCAMILLMSSKRFTSLPAPNQYWVLSLVAFSACALKCLSYFEFVTSSLIAMMIPVLYTTLQKRMKLDQALRFFIYPSLAAIAAVFAVYVLKFGCIAWSMGSLQEAYEVSISNLMGRVVGDSQNETAIIVESARVPVHHVLIQTVRETAFSLRGIFFITYAGLIALCGLLSCVKLYQCYKQRDWQYLLRQPLMICMWVSLLAPLSWFTLAKPHTYIHLPHCLPLWCLPFSLLAVAFVITASFKKGIHQ